VFTSGNGAAVSNTPITLRIRPYVMLLNQDAPGGFVREWPRLQDRHLRHLSYAGQWFLLAGVTVCAYLALLRSRRRPSA